MRSRAQTSHSQACTVSCATTPADRRADFGGARGILLQPGDLAAHPFVERGAQLGAVRAHLVEFGVHRRQHAPRDRGAECPADQPAALLAHALLDRGAQRFLLAGEQGREAGRGRSRTPPGGGRPRPGCAARAPPPGRRRGRPGCAARCGRRRRRARPSSTVARMRGSMAASATAAGRAEAGSARKRCRMPGRSRRASTPGDLVGGEHVGGDEAAEGGAETLLLVRDDGGVRDRDAERMAEQRGDREPVGDAADEAGLGGGLEQVGGGRGGQGVAAQGEGGHQDEKGGGEGPVAAQRAPGFGVGVRWDHTGRAYRCDRCLAGVSRRVGLGRVLCDGAKAGCRSRRKVGITGARCTGLEHVQCGGGEGRGPLPP